MGFNDFLSKLFGNKSQRDLKEINPYVDKIKAVYPSIEKLTDDQLRAKSDEIKQRIQDFVKEDKAKVAELKASIETLEIDQREGIWEQVKDEVLMRQGDIQGIDLIPQAIKDVYKTSFQLSPYAFIEVAARAQKWVDQAISRNMYLETRNVDDYVNIYSECWKRGLKTTYYLHVKPRHQAEQSTTHVNKTEELAKASGGARKSGFGFAKKQSVGAGS